MLLLLYVRLGEELHFPNVNLYTISSVLPSKFCVGARQGYGTVRTLENVEVAGEQPAQECLIDDCGELPADADLSTITTYLTEVHLRPCWSMIITIKSKSLKMFDAVKCRYWSQPHIKSAAKVFSTYLLWAKAKAVPS